MRERVPRVAVAVALMLVRCAPAKPHAAFAAVLPQQCAAAIVSSRKLRLTDGRWLRIEATVVVAADGEALIAGVPANITRVEANGSEHLEARDSLLGALVHANGDVTPVYAPINGSLVSDVRGQRLPSGRWLLTFGEAEAGGQALSLERPIARVWSGEFDGERWTRVQQIAADSFPAGARKASPMIRRGDTAIVAMPYTEWRDAALLRYVNGQWTHQRVPMPGFAEVAIASDRKGVPMMTVVRGDASLHSDINSLFLLRDEPPWRELPRIALGGPAPINFAAPVFADANWLVWAAEIPSAAGSRWELRARRLDARGMPADSTIVVEPAIWRFATVASPSSARGYIVAATNTAHELPRLRIYATGSSSVTRLLDVENPYADFRSATMLSHEQLLLVGRSEPRPGEATLQSMLVTVSTSCDAKAP